MYIYIERERERENYISIYIYIHLPSASPPPCRCCGSQVSIQDLVKNHRFDFVFFMQVSIQDLLYKGRLSSRKKSLRNELSFCCW